MDEQSWNMILFLCKPFHNSWIDISTTYAPTKLLATNNKTCLNMHIHTSYSDLFAKSVDNKNILMISNQNVFNFTIIIWVNIIIKNTCVYIIKYVIYTLRFFILAKHLIFLQFLQEHLLQKKIIHHVLLLQTKALRCLLRSAMPRGIGGVFNV